MIGILTFYQCYNYGAYLQAYALQRYLLDNGYENELINYRSRKSEDNEYRTIVSEDGKGWVQRVRILAKIVIFKVYHRKMKRSGRFYTREELSGKFYPTIIVGSDQIWCYTKEWGGLDTTYFSDGLHTDRIITYAASMGPDKWDQPHPRSIGRLIKNFSSISVRDTNTWQFAKLFHPAEPQLVLDPTLLYDFRKEERKVPLRNYILFYSDGLEPAGEMIKALRELARDNALKIVSVGKKFDWCDMNIVALSPFRWLGYFRNARFIFTCMYHGLLFSLKCNKDFAMFLNPGRENKCLDFLKRTGLENRVATDHAVLRQLFKLPIDYSPVNAFLEKQRDISEEFIRKNM
jgi:hypothetical protein